MRLVRPAPTHRASQPEQRGCVEWRGRRGDDHLVGQDSAVRALDDELPTFIPRQGKNIDPESDRQAESFYVLLEIVRHLIFRGVRSLVAVERQPGQAVVAR